jgi:predicted DNA-binding transcriptional regulator AlpA
MNLPAPHIVILPRLIRLRDVPAYLGMDRNRFGNEVRPFVTTVPIGKQGIAFDRLELDAWVEEYISRNGRPGRLQGERLWDVEDRPASLRGGAYGTSTNGSKGGEFAKALAQISSQKRSDTSQD